jgi:thioredoxin-dependent peroxiredoxin
MTFKLLFYFTVLLIAFFGYRSYSSASQTLQIGDIAPSFTLNDAQGQTHYLSDYAGSYLVLYFYPKDDTPGCTREACHFRDDISQLENLRAKIVGVSVDDSVSHAKFSTKFHLPFPLLSDKDGAVADSYHALTNLYLIKIAKRYTFLIDPTGKIAKIYTNVDTATHSKQIIEDLKSIQIDK